MTTVAYRDGIIAADMSVYGNSGFGGTCHKIVKNEQHHVLAGYAGLIQWGTAFLEEVEEAEDPFSCELWLPRCSIGLMVGRGTPIFIVMEGTLIALQDEYYAIGSGAGYAMAAMGAGATAVEAVRIASGIDPFTKGPLEWITNRITDNVLDIKTGAIVKPKRVRKKRDGGAK